MTVEIPIRTVNALNVREHPQVRAKRARYERQTAYLFLRIRQVPALPVRVELTRLSKRLMDDDGLAASLKHCRDGIADAYGVDDGDPRYQWVYRQEKAKAFGVRVHIESAAAKVSVSGD